MNPVALLFVGLVISLVRLVMLDRRVHRLERMIEALAHLTQRDGNG